MKHAAASVLLGLVLTFCASAAGAHGTVTIHKVDKPAQTYNNVKIVVRSLKELLITSADGKGTLIIDKAACSYVGELQMCLPDSVKLRQAGATNPIGLEQGTVIVNLTDHVQPLSASSMRLPPRGILLSLTTKIGTVINMTGVIDEMTQ